MWNWLHAEIPERPLCPESRFGGRPAASVRGRCCAVREPTAVARAFRATATSLSRGVELIVSNAGAIGTRTDIQQANGFLLAQESAAARDDGD